MSIRNIKRFSYVLVVGLLLMNLPFLSSMPLAQEEQKMINIIVNGKNLILIVHR